MDCKIFWRVSVENWQIVGYDKNIGGYMRRAVKKKRWLDKRSRKLQNRKRRKRNSIGRSIYYKPKKVLESEGNIFVAKAPKVFSFIENPEETIEFFDDIITEIEGKSYEKLFYIDSSDVIKVSADALIYLIAILNNLKLRWVKKYSFKGNLPVNREAEAFYAESGFLNYVKSKRTAMPKGDDKVEIISDNTVNTELAKRMCDFVCRRFGKDKKFTINLYKTLIELMSNTIQHAYNNNSIMAACWYLFAKHEGNTIQITFTDTGEGIPGTVRKKWYEFLPKAITDSELIYSAFKGESRTETKKANRGHGLPDLYKKAIKHELNDFHVFSGASCCKFVEVNGEQHFQRIDYTRKVIGTMYQFIIVNKGE